MTIVTRYGTEIDLSREGKSACPKCRKKGNDVNGDNLHVYGLDENGKHRGAHCFCCEWTFPSQEWIEENGQVEEEIELVGTIFNDEIHSNLKDRTGVDSKNFRGIKTDVSKFFGVRYEYSEEDGSISAVYYPCTTDFKLSGYKKRAIPKQFSAIGDVGRDADLFGQFRFQNVSGKYCLLVAGEADQLAAYSMMKEYYDTKGEDTIPVVSGTTGEKSSYKQIQKHYEWFNRFERIHVCYDMDEAGREAVEAVVKVLPKGKVFVMQLPMKDSNDMLLAGKQRDFVRAFFNAKPYVPSGIVGSSSLGDKIREAEKVPKVPLPPFMRKVQDLMAGGIPLKRIVNLGSASGTGKSTIIDEMVYFWILNSPHKPGVVTLESDCSEYGKKLISRHMGRKIDLIDDYDYKQDFLSSEAFRAAEKELFETPDGQDRFHLVEERDGSVEDIKDLIMQLIIQCECKIIILDPLQDILDGMNIDEQAVFMKWLKGATKSHDVTFVLVNHVRKSSSGQKANSTGADLHEEDFQGSSSIFKSAACNLLFTRNKEHEDEMLRNVTTMKMTKCRWTGRTSPVAGQFYYSNETHTLYDYDDYIAQNPRSVEF